MINIQIIISKKIINNIFDNFYKKLKKFIKSLIKKLQTKGLWIKKFHIRKSASSRRLRKLFSKWIINDKIFVKYNEHFYVLDDTTVRKNFIQKHHDDLFSKHFEIQKTLNLIQRKYFWLLCKKQTRIYIRICNVCQCIKISRYLF